LITLRQIEALHWIERLGTFERAAARLNTTQSAISKRMQELELSSGLMVFDRSQRGARLTEQGEELLALGRQMLNISDEIAVLKNGSKVSARRLRVGVTELTALTWLPRLVTALIDRYPGLTIEPDVDMSRTLHERLMDDALDLIVIPEGFAAPEVTSVPLAQVINSWMAKPGLVPPGRTLTLDELVRYPILTQGRRSGSGLHFSKWLRASGVEFKRTISSDSMTAVLGLIVAGLGISYLPVACFQPLIDAGTLVIVPTDPEPPPVTYSAMFRNDRPSAFAQVVAEIAGEVCDFSRQLQTGPTAGNLGLAPHNG